MCGGCGLGQWQHDGGGPSSPPPWPGPGIARGQGESGDEDLAGNVELLRLTMLKKTSAAKELITAGRANVSAADSKGRTALHFAASNDNEELVAFLLEHGADPNVQDLNGSTPLHLATMTSKGICELLVDAGAKSSAVDTFGKTALHWVTERLGLMKTDILQRRRMYGGEEEQEEVKAKIIRELEAIIDAVSLPAEECQEDSDEARLVQQLQGIRIQAEELDLDQLDVLLQNLSLT